MATTARLLPVAAIQRVFTSVGRLALAGFLVGAVVRAGRVMVAG